MTEFFTLPLANKILISTLLGAGFSALIGLSLALYNKWPKFAKQVKANLSKHQTAPKKTPPLAFSASVSRWIDSK